MKRLSSIVLCLAASFVTAGTAVAQTDSVRASVPFAFAVGRTWLPAGDYIITETSQRQISIEDAATRRMVALSLIQPENLAATGPGNLLFHEYGERYFLTSITCPASATTASLPMSTMERRVKKMQQEAMKTGEPGVVLVALNR
jgi:hypothetical protein